jgi:hypothetical protein
LRKQYLGLKARHKPARRNATGYLPLTIALKGQHTDGKYNNNYAALTGRLFMLLLPAALQRVGLCCPFRAEEKLGILPTTYASSIKVVRPFFSQQ